MPTNYSNCYRFGFCSQIVFAVLAIGLGATPSIAEEGETTAAKALAILEDKCAMCHGQEDPTVQGLDMRDFESLTRDRGENFHPYLTPGDLKKSQLWVRVVNDSMPPRDFEPLSDEEKEVLKTWIEQGAEWVDSEEKERPFVSNADVLEAIYQDLSDRRTSRPQRRLRRYFSITHLHNNPNISAATLRMYRAALSKAVNSLSNESRIILPEAIDEHETVFRIVLSDFGWDDLSIWQQVLERYPYGLRPLRQPSRTGDGAAELEFFQDIEKEYGDVDFDGVPFIRADWFISNALRPPLYHVLLKVPNTRDELDELLGYDRDKGYRLEKVRRAGVTKSGVSGQNRVLEHHSSDRGPYWESYDFAPKAERSYLMRFPLGPEEAFGDEFKRFAFDPAGGEIIFNLNNGLHGYMLIDGEGDRIDEGPVDIVSDKNQTAGSPVIVNGLSCIGCHKAGMLDAPDDIRAGWAINNAAFDKVEAIYATREEMAELLEETTSDYLRALERAIGPFLVKGKDYNEKISEYKEPIQAAVKMYLDDISLQGAAAELGYEDQRKLENQLDVLRDIGLGPLASGGKLPRAVWETENKGVTLFQEAARELKLATPQQAN